MLKFSALQTNKLQLTVQIRLDADMAGSPLLRRLCCLQVNTGAGRVLMFVPQTHRLVVAT